jgi:hypothetical protein
LGQKANKDDNGAFYELDEECFDSLPSPNEIETEYDTFVGLDPGKNYLATAFWGKEVDRKSKVVKGKGEVTHKKSEVVKISSSSYRHEAKMDEYNAWEKRLRKTNKEDYGDKIRNLPSLKTASLAKCSDGIKTILTVSVSLIPFFGEKGFRNRRFKAARYTQKALVKASKQIVEGCSKGKKTRKGCPKNKKTRKGCRKGAKTRKGCRKGGKRLKRCSDDQKKKKTLIGFGDWKQSAGFKGGPMVPLKKFRRELRKHATVVMIHEYFTSQVCSACESEIKVKNIRRNKREWKRGNVEVYEVVRCQNRNCAKSWQRDINASRNMYRLLHCLLKGEERPEVFCCRLPSDSRCKPKKQQTLPT